MDDFRLKTLAVSLGIALAICIPSAFTVVSKLQHQEVRGTFIKDFPSFHSKISGYSRNGKGSPISGEIWFNGYAVKGLTQYRESLTSIQGGKVEMVVNRDGKIVRKFVTIPEKVGPHPAFFLKALFLVAPIPPYIGTKITTQTEVQIQVGGKNYSCTVETYNLPIDKKNDFLNPTAVSIPTQKLVYISGGKIVRTVYRVEFEKGRPQDEVHDFYYEPLDPKQFYADSLKPFHETNVKVPYNNRD